MAYTKDLLQRSTVQPKCQGPHNGRSNDAFRKVCLEFPPRRHIFGLRLFQRRRVRKLIFVAAGNGMETVMGMLRYLRETNDQRSVAVLHICQPGDSLTYQKEVDTMPRHIRYSPIGRALGQQWVGRQGCLSKERLLAANRDFWPDAHVFLCGPEELIEQVRPLLLELGVKKGRICPEITPDDCSSGTAEQRLKA